MWGKQKSLAAQFKFTEKTSKKAAFFRFWLPGVEVKGKSCEVFISKVSIIEKAKALDFDKGCQTAYFLSPSLFFLKHPKNVTLFAKEKNRMAKGVSPPRHPICCSHVRTAST